MRLTHKQKLKKARSMLNPEEVKNHTSPFRSIKWVTNKIINQARELFNMDQAEKRREEKKNARNIQS